MTPERLSYLMQENLLRGECSATRDELHWIFTQLAIETKCAEDAEVWGQDTVCRLTNEKEAAEAKLAAAIKEQDKYKAAYEREQRTHEILKSCGYDVSALGIDPSKEQGK